MKLQCPCGAKYAFDISPEMAQNPVKFICPTCGLDSSEFVNDMIRREFGVAAPAESVPLPPTPPAPAAPAPSGPRLRISHEEKPAAPPPEASAPTTSKYCSRHRGVLAKESCAVCHKPICPQCMELFGYFCSPLCKNKADLQGMDVPVYAGQKFEVERQFWRKAGLIFSLAVTVIVALLGVWIWYSWFGSIPHPYYAVRFEDTDRAYSGRAQLVSPDQLVFLHGGTLARYDLKTKKAVWTQELVSKEQVDAIVKEESDAIAKEAASGEGYMIHRDPGEIEREARRGLQEQLQLRVSGQNIWVGQGEKLKHYDWANGSVVREIALPEYGGALIEAGDELQMLGAQSVTHISLATGDARVEQFLEPGAEALAKKGGAGEPPGGGLFSADGKPLDPKAVAAQAQNLKLSAQIALPALLSNKRHEQQIEAALRDDPKHPRSKDSPAEQVGHESFELIPGKTGFVQFAQTLLEEKLVERSAMKAAPKKSALDGEVNAAHTGEIVNEILNEMQRNSGGDTVTEDESRYKVTVHLPDAPSAADWTGEVTGPPQLFVLKTVNVIAAGKNLVILDKANKKLWSTTLTYPVSGGERFSGEESQFGEGPCVEHGDTLYVFDSAVLSAFDLGNGNARWRLPSVGIVGLFFDSAGSIYVNTTSGNPDDIKYSRQIDITKATDDILLKLDPKTGKTLWSIKPGGFISYLSGKFIYTVQSYDPNPRDSEKMSDMTLQKPAYLRIARINPKNGRIMFEHYQDRCPISVQFADNSIQLVFKREVQVLRFLTF